LVTALDFLDALAPDSKWVITGGNGRATATITAIGGHVVCVSSEAATSALALLAALVKAKGGR
jgi:hypothetical protein